MEFGLTEEREIIKREVRKFCEKEIAPYAKDVDQGKILPFEHFKKLAKYGFFAPSIPQKYGGQGVDLLTSSIIGIEISRVCPATSLSIGASVLLCGGTIYNNGNEEQKLKYLVPIAKGEKIGCWGMTEPDAGSDIASIKTSAVKDGDYYILNGSKTFITNAPYADIFVVYAITKKGARHNGMSAFILEKAMEGVEVSKPMKKMGMRGSPTGEIYLNDARVHKSQLLGVENMGFWESLKTLNDERALAPSLALGMMERCLEMSIKYAKERVQFGKPIATKQAISFKIAKMYTMVETVRNWLFRLIWMREKGLDYAKEASAAKIYSSRAAVECALEAIQIHGGYGYMEDFEVERYLRDAKLLEIGGGTTEIQHLIISRMLLRLEEKEKKESEEREKIKHKPTEGGEKMEVTCKDIFNAIPKRFKPEAAGDWSAVIQFNISGERGGNYYISVKDKICTFSEGIAENPTATVTTTDETYIGMALGKVDPQMAFMMGQILVSGNIADVIKLNNPNIFTREIKS